MHIKRFKNYILSTQSKKHWSIKSAHWASRIRKQSSFMYFCRVFYHLLVWVACVGHVFSFSEKINIDFFFVEV